MDATFITTSPSALNFLPKSNNSFYIPNPSDRSFETLNNFNKSCNVDVFFALSHGVHRGKLKSGKEDDRIIFLEELQKITADVKFDYMELTIFNLFGLITTLKQYLMQKWVSI